MPPPSFSAIILLLSTPPAFFLNSSFLFHVMAVFPNHFPPISLWCFLSKFMPHSQPPVPHSCLLSLSLPSYFILALPLIRPSISLVHSSLSLSLSLSCLTHPSLHFTTAYPPVPFFFLTFSHTLFLSLFHSPIFMLH